jgi:hypothetical protein
MRGGKPTVNGVARWMLLLLLCFTEGATYRRLNAIEAKIQNGIRDIFRVFQNM